MTDNISAVAIVAEVLPTDLDGTAFLGLDGGEFRWGDPAGVAQRVVDALRAAGRLLPEGGEAELSWGVRVGREDRYVGEGEGSEWLARREVAAGRGQLVQRTTTHWPDKSTSTGPWVAVDQEATDE